MLLVQLPVLLDEDLVEGQARGGALPAPGRRDDFAAGLLDMRAIVELAAPEEGAELAHRLADLVLGEVEEAEGLEAGRVDDRGVAVEAVEARERGGVRARVARGGGLAPPPPVNQPQP